MTTKMLALILYLVFIGLVIAAISFARSEFVMGIYTEAKRGVLELGYDPLSCGRYVSAKKCGETPCPKCGRGMTLGKDKRITKNGKQRDDTVGMCRSCLIVVKDGKVIKSLT